MYLVFGELTAELYSSHVFTNPPEFSNCYYFLLKNIFSELIWPILFLIHLKQIKKILGKKIRIRENIS